MTTTTGQRIVNSLESWINSWIAFSGMPSGQALVCALWTLHTYFSPLWPATSYMHISSDGPGCGKTTLLEVLASLSFNARLRATLRPLSVCRSIEECDGRCSYFFDQVEALGKAALSDVTSILAVGYTQGGTHEANGNAYRVYCAKAFAGIGAFDDVFKSRSIEIHLAYGEPRRIWTDAAVTRQGEADQLIAECEKLFGRDMAGHKLDTWTSPEWTPPVHLQGRERQIWTPIYSVANALMLDADTMRRLNRAVEEMIARKQTAETKTYRELRDDKTDAGKDKDQALALRALTDLASVLDEPSKTLSGDIHSAVAIARMREKFGLWAAYKGVGLDPVSLAAFIGRFGVKTNGRVRMIRGRKGEQLRGYAGTQVRAAVAKLSKGQE